MSMQEIGQILYDYRLQQGLTQDQLGAKYGITGPAVFKFEKGFVRPSLELWLRIALDAGVAEQTGVLLWLRAKLPEKYRDYVELKKKGKSDGKPGVVDYSEINDRDELRAAALKDKKMQKGLRDMISDDDVWEMFKPTGHELNLLRDIFCSMGKGTREQFVDAIRLIREFTHSF